ncbi:DUF1259 domain-containing protein [Novosphingobium sp. ST904]|uniref:DUF1259 domain-containing protein n=1 Tax=Novosphingobium sp. ST904 TaxID=1684385 RepID=UPI000AAB945E|nr:DUF1259 domain-containing protein [Novosphingobium sp. ST904]
MRHLLLPLAIALAAPAAAQTNPQATPPEANRDRWALVDKSLGRAGTTQPDGVRRYGFPRSDLNVQLDGVTIKPALALGSWAAFHPMGDQVMIMGDLVLTHEEVNPVMSRLLASGFTITALHNHLLRSAPATMYMHIGGHGDPVKLAAALREALAASRTPMTAPSRDSQPPSAARARRRQSPSTRPRSTG